METNNLNNDLNNDDNHDEFRFENSTTTTLLTPELIMRAELEVNEKDAWRQRDIEALRELIRGEPSLHCRLDDAFLLRFLRAKRFDYDGAFRLICNYLTLNYHHPELFQSIDELKCIFDSDLMTILDDKSNNDETIFLLRFGKWSTRLFNFDQIIAAAIMFMEYVIRDEITQINGIICIIDMDGFGWNQMKKFGTNQARKCINIMEHYLPIRIKQIYIINESTLTDICFTIIRPFMNEELYEKIIFLGQNYQKFMQENVIKTLSIFPKKVNSNQYGNMNSDEWYEKLKKFQKEMKHNFFDYGFKQIDNNGNNIDDDNEDDINNNSNSENEIIMIDINKSIRYCTGGSMIGGCRPNNSNNFFMNNNTNTPSSTMMASSKIYGINHNNHSYNAIFRKSQTCNGYLFDYYNTNTSID